MRRSRWLRMVRALFAVGLLLATLGLLAACGSDGGATPASPTADATATAASEVIARALGAPLSDDDRVATAVAATLTAAAPTGTTTVSPTPLPPPDGTAVAAALGTQIATELRATLTAAAAQTTTAAATPIVAPTATPAPPPPTPTATLIAVAVALPTPTDTSEPAPANPSPPPCRDDGPFRALGSEYLAGLGCSLNDVEVGPITLEPFQGGYLAWIKADDLLYVIGDDGRWSAHPNDWQAGEPALPCTAAASYGYPAMGFGKLWCTNATVNSRLGAPLGPEGPDDNALRQQFDHGQVFQASGDRTFILLADGTGWILRGSQ